MHQEKLISIHLNSNRPQSFKNFITSLAENASQYNSIEVIVNVDKGDEGMLNIIEELNKNYPNLIKTIETELIKSFSDAWKPLNILLKETSSSVRFISCMSDEIIFKTKNWDLVILNYFNFFKDNIFRIRCSKYKNEVYSDIWECGYKPDSYAFYTKKWLDLVGQWNPCIGPDTYQECISYYMNKYGIEYQRNIVCNKIKFNGEEVSSGLSVKKRMERSRIYYKAFFKLMSYSVQKTANRLSFKIICEISNSNNIPAYIPIKRNKVYLTNFMRRFNFFYYRGAKQHIINTKMKNIIYMIWCYSNFLDKYLVKIINFLYNKNYLSKIIKNEKNLKEIENIINNGKST